MPNNKKHHYVPHFYLKRFSPNGKSINLWNIPKELKVISANLKNQCCKDYFYGKDLKVESALGVVEGLAAQTFRLIDHYATPPPYGSAAHLILIVYLLMQYGRTTYSADSLNEMSDKMMKHLLGPKAAAEGIDLSKVTIGIKNAPHFFLGMTSTQFPVLLDLDFKLLSNETDVEFVASDNPVVLYNQLFSFRRFGSNTGFLSKGLQIFFPISSKTLLLFYDSASYSVSNRSHSVTRVLSPRDVYEINTLQMCSAYENVYFQDEGFNIEALHRKAAPFRRQRKSNVDIFPGEETENRKQEFIATSLEEIRTNLKLSIMRITKKTKKWRDGFRKLKTQPAVVVRNEKMADDYDEFLKKVDNKEYKHGDFIKFLADKYGQT